MPEGSELRGDEPPSEALASIGRLQDAVHHLRLQLIEQEHRPWTAWKRRREFRRGTPEDIAARSAFKWLVFRWTLFGSGAAAGAGAAWVAAVGTVWTAGIATDSLIVLKDQNRRIDLQSQLLESQRRSTFVFVMADLIQELTSLHYEHLRAEKDGGLTDQFECPVHLAQRFAAISQTLRPYYALDASSADDAVLARRPLSPERAQLLLSLVNAPGKPLLTSIGFGCTFAGADLRGVRIPGADAPEIDLSGADLSGANLTQAVMPYADLRGALLAGALLNGADFTGAKLEGTDFSGANLRGTDFFPAEFIGTNDPQGRRATELSGAIVGTKDEAEEWMRANLTGSEWTMKRRDDGLYVLTRQAG